MKQPTRYPCPGCGTLLVWTTDNPDRPFCSARCRNLDLVGWANEEKVISGNPVYDELFSDDLDADTSTH